MSTPFVTTLRSRPGTVDMAGGDASAITVRVQLAEAWDVVRVAARPSEPVANVKLSALDAFDAEDAPPADYVVSNRGVRIFDESVSLADAGVVNGATLLVAHRHRRPVR
jgi:hypothetical protein